MCEYIRAEFAYRFIIRHGYGPQFGDALRLSRMNADAAFARMLDAAFRSAV